MTTIHHARRWLLAAACVSTIAPAAAAELTLGNAEALALQHDSGYASLVKQSAALVDRATADGQLPDPMFSVGWLNLPVEDFNTTQEPMSQIRVGIKQAFPPGDTLAVKRDGDLAAAGAAREQAAERRLATLLDTRRDWLEVQYAEATLAIVRRNEAAFAELSRITTELYRTGKKSLNDVVRADLEVQRIKDREVSIAEMIAKQRAMLARWVGSAAAGAELPRQLPDWRFDPSGRAALDRRVSRHPLVLAMDQAIAGLGARVRLARAQYKPGWTLELGYSFRNATRANGTRVSNVASIGATVNLPVFTANRQDKRLAAASTDLEAARDRRRDLIAALSSRLTADIAGIVKLDARISLHRRLIVPQAKAQAKAALMAYRANRADFAEVMRSRIAELDSLIALRRLETDRLLDIASVRYLVPPRVDAVRTTTTSISGDQK